MSFEIPTETITVNGEEREVYVSGEHLVGYVDVDAGLMLVGDPCYYSKDNPMQNWSEFCDRLFKEEIGKEHLPTVYRLPHREDHYGKGVVTSTGYGDGSYPVYVTITDEGIWGRRVAGLRVEFIGEMEEDLL